MSLRQFLARIFRFIEPEPPPAVYADETTWAAVSFDWPQLTGREAQIAWYIRQGYTNDQIALELGIKSTTVKSHVHNLLYKFNLRSRFLLQELLNNADFDPWRDGFLNE